MVKDNDLETKEDDKTDDDLTTNSGERRADNADSKVTVSSGKAEEDASEINEKEKCSTDSRSKSKVAVEHFNRNGSDKDDSNDGMLPVDLLLQEIGAETVTDDDKQEGTKKLRLPEEKEEKPSDKDSDQSCSNPTFRYKVLDTLFLFWNTTTMGWVYGQMGPALPDLQLVAGVPLQQATWLFTGFAIGYLGGCLLSGLIQDRFNPRLMLFIYTLGTAVSCGLLPWIPQIIAMVIIRVVCGICIGGQDTGLHSMLFAIWAGEGGPFIQMTHVLSALGGVLAPLVTEPFVSVHSEVDGDTGRSLMNISSNSTDSVSSGTNSYVASAPNISTKPLNDTTRMAISEVVEVKIQYAFLITGILVFSAAVPFLVAFLQKRRVMKATRQYSSDSVDRHKLPTKVKRFILGVLLVNSLVATAYIDLFPSFITTFIMGQLNWSQQSASTLTSIFFATYAIGNFIGVFILAYISASKLIVFSYISTGIMLLGVLLSVRFEQTELVWITMSASGITMSAILPTLFTWTQENVAPITARLASALLISGSVGVMLNPLFLGYMMDVFTPMWFIYLSLGETVFCASLFATAYILSRIYSSKRTQETSVTPTDEEEKPCEMIQVEPSKTEIYPRGSLYGV